MVALGLDESEISRRRPRRSVDDFPTWNRSALARAARRIFLPGFLLPLNRIFAHVHAHGLENLKDLEPPVIFASNHQSYMDVPAILSALPARWRYRVTPAMRKEFFEEHFHGRSFTNSLNYYLSTLFFNAFPIPQREPGALATLRYIGELSNDKWCLLIFPEGKMTRAGEIAPFQPGVGMIASKLGIPVVPIRIEGLDRVLHERLEDGAAGPRRHHVRARAAAHWRRLPCAGAASGRRGAKALINGLQNSSICSLAATFGLRGVRNGLPTTPSTWMRASAALRDEDALVLKPRIGRHHRKTERVQLQKVVRKDSVHGVAIAKIHPQPQSLQFGPRGEQAQLLARLALLEIAHEADQFHLVVRHDVD